MLYNKQGYPEEAEIVLCTITSVQPNGVFVTLDEYGNRTGIIHISEVAPGRIRNIRDFVVEGKKVMCKVLRIYQDRGHLDLSLRRVTESQKRQKQSQIKQEILAERIIDFAAKDLKMDLKELYKIISQKVLKAYEMVYPCFEEIAFGQYDIKKLGFDKKIEEKLELLIKQRIKPPAVSITGAITFITYHPEGVEVIKKGFEKIKSPGISFKYAGAGKYNVMITAEDYKTAEKLLEKMEETIGSFAEEHDGEARFERAAEKKKKSSA